MPPLWTGLTSSPALARAVEPLGKLVASGAMVSGLLVVALPITIIGGNYQEVHDEVMKAGAESAYGSGPKLPELASQLEGQLAELDASMQSVAALFAKAADSNSNDSAGESGRRAAAEQAAGM